MEHVQFILVPAGETTEGLMVLRVRNSQSPVFGYMVVITR